LAHSACIRSSITTSNVNKGHGRLSRLKCQQVERRVWKTVDKKNQDRSCMANPVHSSEMTLKLCTLMWIWTQNKIRIFA